MRNKFLGMGSASCRNSYDMLPEQLASLNRQTKNQKITVASMEEVDKDLFDFPNIVEAFTWVKQVGSATNQPNTIMMVLEKGTHLLDTDDVLKEGLSTVDETTQSLYLRGVNLIVTCSDVVGELATVYIDSRNPLLVFDQSRIKFENIKFATKKIMLVQKEISIVGLRSTIDMSNVIFQDTGIFAADDSVIKLYNRCIFKLTNVNPFDTLVAIQDSYILVEDADFDQQVHTFTALDKSDIFLKSYSGYKRVIYTSPLNFRTNDNSAIYNSKNDGMSGKLKVEEYRYIATANQIEFTVLNKHIDSFMLYLNGGALSLMDYVTEIKGKDTIVTINKHLDDGDVVLLVAYAIADYITLFTYEFDSAKGQKDFTIAGHSAQDLEVYLNGVHMNKSEYTLSTNSVDTTVSVLYKTSAGDKIKVIMHNA